MVSFPHFGLLHHEKSGGPGFVLLIGYSVRSRGKETEALAYLICAAFPKT
jgi:hypothetical protein